MMDAGRSVGLVLIAFLLLVGSVRSELKPGNRLSVVLTSGSATSGRLKCLSDSGLELTTKSGMVRRLPVDSIQSLSQQRNLALQGCGVMGLGSFLTLAVVLLDDEQDRYLEVAIGTLAGCAVGAIFGSALKYDVPIDITAQPTIPCVDKGADLPGVSMRLTLYF